MLSAAQQREHQRLVAKLLHGRAVMKRIVETLDGPEPTAIGDRM